MEFLYEPEFWVAVSFFLFVGGAALSRRAQEARRGARRQSRDASPRSSKRPKRLREEAEKVLADYRRKQGDAAKETQAIIDLAAKEAEILAAETRRSMKEHFERRMKLAEDKIARAEAEALREVREAAADAAVAAAQTVIAAEAHARGRRQARQARHRRAQGQAELVLFDGLSHPPICSTTNSDSDFGSPLQREPRALSGGPPWPLRREGRCRSSPACRSRGPSPVPIRACDRGPEVRRPWRSRRAQTPTTKALPG